MKVKLLKKLRKKHVIYERNGLYDYQDKSQNRRYYLWTTLSIAKQKRNYGILSEARYCHETYKKTL